MTASQTQSLPDTERYTLEHDTLCRLAALAASCPRHWCRLRRCRRSGICLGALRPVDAGLPPLLLPPCIGTLDAPPMASFCAAFGVWIRRLERRDAAIHTLAMLRRRMSARDSPPPAKGP
jgi:hypothetical protein